MKITDYSKIAERYDKNDYRNKISKDNDLNGVFKNSQDNEFKLLDLACGTGIYLYNQQLAFDNSITDWYGLDASEEMLQIAKEKVSNVELTHGFAEDMPYESNFFNFIVCNYAFHHFTKKAEALDEIFRIIKRNGVFKMHNTAIHQMKDWWVYKYFPSAYYEDLKRYWDKDLVFHELSVRGFDVAIRIEYTMMTSKVIDYLDYVKNRDISVLTLLSDIEYEKGLQKMEYEIEQNLNAEISSDFADIVCLARKL